MKKILAIILTLAMMSTGVTSIATAKKTFETEPKGFLEDFTHASAYYQLKVETPDIQAPEQQESVIDDQLVQLNDTEAMQKAEKTLKEAIKRKSDGDKTIHWNKEFVETAVKNYFPDLYPTIINQIEQDMKLTQKEKDKHTSKSNNVVTESSGSTSQKFTVSHYHWTGYPLWTFWNTIYWYWDSAKVYKVNNYPGFRIYDYSWSFKQYSYTLSEPTRSGSWHSNYIGEYYWVANSLGAYAYGDIDAWLFDGGGYWVDTAIY